MVGITEMDPTIEEVRKTLKERGITFPVTIDRGGKIFAQYGLEAHPVTIVIDRTGKVVTVEVGFVRGDERRIEQAFLPLLNRTRGGRR